MVKYTCYKISFASNMYIYPYTRKNKKSIHPHLSTFSLLTKRFRHFPLTAYLPTYLPT